MIGAIHTKDWTQAPDGNTYYVFTGEVVIVDAKSIIGFPTARTESNWIAQVKGPTQTISIPGCQVRAVFEGQWCSEKNCYRME